jgi:hypothetical protein
MVAPADLQYVLKKPLSLQGRHQSELHHMSNEKVVVQENLRETRELDHFILGRQ